MAAVIGIFEDQFKKNKKLTVVKPGTQKRDFTHVDDIVEGCYLTWKKGRQSDYLLGTGRQYSIIEIAKMFGSKIKYIKKRPGERLSSFLENKRALLHLGYKPKRDIKNYIENFLKDNSKK